MTQVARIFEEEKQQALTQAVQEARQQSAKEIVSLMIKKGYATEEIVSVVPSYCQNDVESLRKELGENCCR